MEYWICFVIVLIGCVIISYALSEKNRYILSIIMMMILTFLSAFRYNIGIDYDSYVHMFQQSDYEVEFGYPEISFRILIQILRYFGFDYQMVFVVYSIFISYFVWKGISYYKRDNFYMVVAIALFGVMSHCYWNSLVQIRQYAAIALLFYATRYLFEKEKIKFIGICVIAFLIHYSAIIMIFCSLIKFDKLKRYMYIYVLIFSFIIADLGIIERLLDLTLNSIGLQFAYFEDLGIMKSSVSTGLGILFNMIIWLVTFCFLRTEMERKLFALFTLGFVFKLLFSFSTPLMRLGEYFYFISVVVISNFILRFRAKQKLIVACMIMGCYGILLLKQLAGLEEGYIFDLRPSAGNIEYKFNFKIFQ